MLSVFSHFMSTQNGMPYLLAQGGGWGNESRKSTKSVIIASFLQFAVVSSIDTFIVDVRYMYVNTKFAFKTNFSHTNIHASLSMRRSIFIGGQIVFH